MTQTIAGYFDDLYRGSDDPYGVRERWYEERKRQLLLATLPARRYVSAYEPGCGVGELTALLAARCEKVLASDLSALAVDRARTRCAALANVRVLHQRLPEQWPERAGAFDLIVLSEVGYFLEMSAVQQVAARCRDSLTVNGTLVACDWLPAFAARATGTRDVHVVFEALGLARIARHEEEDFLLQAWSRDARSVAEREGIR